ncbi:hypothetical protein HZA57_04125 [Candidatus Poribacteria bacterium]|nr:hypothetical protein [Candidatus Poribacteria bacterium]
MAASRRPQSSSKPAGCFLLVLGVPFFGIGLFALIDGVGVLFGFDTRFTDTNLVV